MAESLGKKFEAVTKEQWKKSFPGSFIFRIPDPQSGYSGWGGSNMCDFIGFVAEGINNNTKGQLFLIEVKSHKGNTIPWTAIRQYDKLLTYRDQKDVHVGIIIWFIDHDKVIWCPVEEAKKMHDDGLKSISIKLLQNRLYNILELPSIKKRVFLDTDYTPLLTFYLEKS